MVRANKRNEALRIESALLNKIAMLGTEKTAEAVGVDKSQISRWKRDWIPKFSMLLAVLEWGVVDDDILREGQQIGPNKNIEEWQIEGCHYSGDNVTALVTKSVTKTVTALSPKQGHTKETKWSDEARLALEWKARWGDRAA